MSANGEHRRKSKSGRGPALLVEVRAKLQSSADTLLESEIVNRNGDLVGSGTRVLITGASGFIGQHLARYLKQRGYWVRGVDIKVPEFGLVEVDEFMRLDLREWDSCLAATETIDHVYALAADMGGMGFISKNHGTILRNNTLIDIHTIEASRANNVARYMYASSACIYPEHLQVDSEVTPLREEDAFPAAPQDAYGWEKLLGELACGYFQEEFGLVTRLGRFHNIYGPYGTWDGGREKAPAALCRKVALADAGESIEIWGDGDQTRSFCYIDDCVEGIHRIMHSDFPGPLNLGSERLVTIDELAQIVMAIAGKQLSLKHIPGPQGVRGRNSDNSLLRKVLGWEPSISLETGLATTYQWIEEQVALRRSAVGG